MASTDLTSDSNERALEQLPLLSVLVPEVRRARGRLGFVPVRYEFGETIVAAGDPPDGLDVLGSGMARVLVAGDDGEEVSLNLLREGDSFGEAGLPGRLAPERHGPCLERCGRAAPRRVGVQGAGATAPFGWGVVRDVAIRMRPAPNWENVLVLKVRMDQRERRDHLRISQVGQERPHLGRVEHPL